MFTLGNNSNNSEQIDEFFINGDILGNWILMQNYGRIKFKWNFKSYCLQKLAIK